MSDPSCLLSFMMPAFNRESYISETLNSLLAQTDPRWECVIVDDGSTDSTPEIAQQYAARDPRIRFYRRERNPKGACPCRNIAVDHSRGRYLTFLDTDDLAAPHCVAQRLGVMEKNPGLDFAILPALQFREKPGDLGRWWNVDKPHEDELARQFKQDAICQGTGPVFTREAFDRAGRWSESLSLWQDIDLFFTLYIRGFRYAKFFHLEPDIHIRELATSLSRSDFHARHKYVSRIEVVQRAVQTLRECGMPDRIHEASHMTAELVTGCARSGKPDLAASLLRWAEASGVFTPDEAGLLKRYGTIARFRLYRLPPFRRFQEKVLAAFACPGNTMGKVPSSEPAIHGTLPQTVR